MMELIAKILLFMIEHPEVIIGFAIVDFIGIVLLEWESKRYYKKHPEEYEEERLDDRKT